MVGASCLSRGGHPRALGRCTYDEERPPVSSQDPLDRRVNEPLGSGPCSLVKASCDYGPGLNRILVRARIPRLSHFQTSKPPKLWTIRDILSFEATKFWDSLCAVTEDHKRHSLNYYFPLGPFNSKQLLSSVLYKMQKVLPP